MSGGSNGRRVIVLGGSSDLAAAIAIALQRRAPREVALLGRSPERLSAVEEKLLGAGCEHVVTLGMDALDTDTHAELIDRAITALGGVDLVIVAVGVLGERGGLPDDVPAALEVLRVNVVGTGSLVLHAAARLRDRGGGALVVLSSVAAERPRRANVVYGASKAGLDALAQGLGDALRDSGVRVLVARPGFVPTRMTRGLPPAPLSSTPEAVARAVVNGLDRGAHTVRSPRALRPAAMVMRLLPRPLFRRLSL